MPRNRRRRDAPQIEPLAPAQNRRQHLLHIRRRHQKLRVRRRLLQRLQQRIKCRRREHVHLVDDVDLELPARRRKPHILPQLTHLLHAVVARTVDLDHIQRTPLRDFPANIILRIEIRPRPVRRIQRHRKDSRRRSLPRPARPHKNVRMRDTILLDGIAQRLRDVLLTEDIIKLLRAIFACEDRVTHPAS